MKCPYCGEEIKDEAVVCRYCHRELAAIRLQEIESRVKKKLEDFEDSLQILNARLQLLENTSPQPSYAVTSRISVSLVIVVLATGILSIGSVYLALSLYLAGLFVLPAVIIIGAGIWSALNERERTIRYYALIGASISAMNYLGVMFLLASLIKVQFIVLLAGITRTPSYHLVLLSAPFFLFIFGAFLGEWLESRQPNGRSMDYPLLLAKEISKLRSNNNTEKIDIEKLAKLLSAVAPLIASFGGILLPIITLLIGH